MGIEVDRIVNSNESSIDLTTCLICHDIFWKPLTCEICENSFCNDCITLWLEKHPNNCPNNCDYKQRQRPPLLLVQLLSKLQVICKNHHTGCKDVLSYESLEQHEHECGFHMEQCTGCSKSMLKKERNIHEKSCEQIELHCHVCQVKYRRINGHNEVECLQNCLVQLQIKIQVLEENDRIQKTTLENLSNRRIIQFDDLVTDGGRKNGRIHYNYANLIWMNFEYLHISYAAGQDQSMRNGNGPNRNGCLQTNSFTHGQEYVTSCVPTLPAFSAISSSNGTLNIHSLYANTMNLLSQIIIKGLKEKNELYTKTIFLTNNSTEIILEWLDIDQIQFHAGLPQGHGNAQMRISRLILT
ncbi:unnamed protein product [Adineta steineri]|uniref:RING-type domain-containing protein n=1 Tax=Adineta steineri TaxID=433720 RepID=A0A816E7M6_9BILA|nr:unnamed protein product [Adineta steineri]CAF1001655.1 unnamed protein product [Adineta steineri]CAF1507397.1 unnamed protein product [Adineta steineri]CAF1646292.1 unnamed protein product [Adineta steineri]